jgi:dTDP-4-dehydrorhamnose 3,5-epimerase
MPSKIEFSIDGIRTVPLNSISDARGTFLKFSPVQELDGELDSVALSFNPAPGTIRGLHFQVEPFSEEKLVSCVQGSVFDVIVDLRPNSKTLGEWNSIELSPESGLQIYLPKGVAHGFQTLKPDSTVHYIITSNYSKESSYAINPFGDLNIHWPLKEAIVSKRDLDGLSIASAKQKYSDSL